MPFQIIRNDITRVRADAIVNTANPRPVIGAGTDTAVHAAAGPALLEARKKIGAIAVGESAATPAFDLPAKYVLHTVSPAWRGGMQGETVLLYHAYLSALQLAKRLHCRSVAFPLLASGSYHFPREIALDTAIRAFTDFLAENRMRIVLVVFDGGAAALAGSLFDDLKSYIDDRYVAEKEREEYDAERRERRERRRIARESAFRSEIRSENAAYPTFGAAVREEAPIAFAQPKAALRPARAAGSLDDFLKQTESSFAEYLRSLLTECGEKDSAVYNRAQISRQLFHKILNRKDYQPTKSTVIQLALGLRLDLVKTRKLLEKAGYSLTRSSKADLVVQYFIEHGEYSVITINTALFDSGLPLLKTGSAL